MTERRPVGAAALALGAVVAVCLYVASFRDVGVTNLGWDAAGSVVQMRAASAGVLDLPGSRPGVGVVGAMAAGAGLVPLGSAPILLSIAAAASLGLAAAVGLRRAWDLPWWGLATAVLLIATWGGTSRLAAGYLANLLSLVLFVVGVAIAIGPAPRWWAAGAAFLAALLAHPGLLPAYATILAGWMLLEVLPARFREDRERRSIPAAVSFAAASVAAAGIVAGVLGVGLDDLQDLAVARERFDERGAEFLTWIDPALTSVMIVGGALVVLDRRERRRSRSAVRLGIAWIAVSAGGIVLLALAPQIPGHRTMLLAVPAPALGALAVVGGATWLIGRTGERARARSVGAIAGAGVVSLAVAAVALGPFDARAARGGPSLDPGAGVVAGYLASTRPEVPVVLVMDPASGRALLAWKAQLNAVRSLAPDAIFLDVALYVGDDRALLEGLPTDRPQDARFRAISERTWPTVEELLPDDPIVLAVRTWVRPDAWARIAGRSPVVGDDLAVLRGPTTTREVVPVEPGRLPLAEAAGRVGLLLVVLGSVGGGWALAASRLRVSPADAIGLAPAVGLAVVTLAGIAITLAGSDPRSAPGLALVVGVSIAGWVLASRVATPDG